MSLQDLVKGYVEGQNLQQEKAKQIANQQADDWERNFKVSQAQSQAANAAAELAVRKQQADTADAIAQVRKQQEDRIGRIGDAKNEIAKQMLALRDKWEKSKQTTKEQIDFRRQSNQIFKDALFKGGFSPLDAQELQQWHNSAFTDEFQPNLNTGGPAGNQSGNQYIQPAAQPAQAPGMNLLQALAGATLGGNPPPAAQPMPAGSVLSSNKPAITPNGFDPSAITNLGKMMQGKMAKQDAQTAEIQQHERWEAAKTEWTTATTAASVAVKSAEARLKGILGDDKLQKMTEDAEMHPLNLQAKEADIDKTKADTERIKSQKLLNEANIQRVDIENKIKNDEGKEGLSISEKNSIRNQNKIDTDERGKAAKEMQDTFIKMKSYENQIKKLEPNDPKRDIYQGVINHLSGDLTRQQEQFDHYDARLRTSNQWMQKYHLIERNTSSGNVVPGARIVGTSPVITLPGGSAGAAAGPAGQALVNAGVRPVAHGTPFRTITPEEIRAGRKSATVAPGSKSSKKPSASDLRKKYGL